MRDCRIGIGPPSLQSFPSKGLPHANPHRHRRNSTNGFIRKSCDLYRPPQFQLRLRLNNSKPSTRSVGKFFIEAR
jgi:hypothetical protein